MDVESLWGPPSLLAAIIGSVVILFVKRIIAQSDKVNIARDKQVDEMEHLINELRLKVGILSTKIEGIVKSIDSMNAAGCNYCRKTKSSK